VGLVVVLPLLPYGISVFTGFNLGFSIELYQALIISGVLSAVLAFIFYKLAVGNAKDLLTKAEL
jgi:uncharacterized MnhB-related membrane protein